MGLRLSWRTSAGSVLLALLALLCTAGVSLAQTISLTDGKVTPAFSVRGAVYTYSVTYSDEDATPPMYVRVVIDGETYTMQRSAGAPDYAAGVVYTYQRRLTTSGTHRYHFEARNASGYAVWDFLRFRAGDVEVEEEEDEEGNVISSVATITIAGEGPYPECYSEITWVGGDREGMVDAVNASGDTLTIEIEGPFEPAARGGDTFELPYSRKCRSAFTVVGDFRDPLVNDAPFLSDPVVSPRWNSDGSQAHWTFKITYSDIEGNGPSFVQLFLGRATLMAAKSVSATETGAVSLASALGNNRLLNVVGVYDDPAGEGVNYYTGGSYNPETAVVTLGTPLPEPKSVYVTYHATPMTWQAYDLIKADPLASGYTAGVEYVVPAPIPLTGYNTRAPGQPPHLYYYSFEAGDGLYDDRRTGYPLSVVPAPAKQLFAAVSEVLGTPGAEAPYPMVFNGLGAGWTETTTGPISRIVMSAAYGPPEGAGFGVQIRTISASNEVTPVTDAKTDDALGQVTLTSAPAAGDTVTGSYVFAEPLQMAQYASPPVLEDGTVTPEIGDRSEAFTYWVTYKDGAGRAPESVTVVIDGVAREMAPAGSGAPDYASGVVYRYSTMLAPETEHQYHFEAVSAGGYAVYDALPLEIVSLQYDYAEDGVTTIATSLAQNWWDEEFEGSEITWVTGLRAGVSDPVEGVRVIDYDSITPADDPTTITVTGVLNRDPEKEPFPGDLLTLNRSRSSLWPIAATGDIAGPYVNDSPTLTNSQASPSTSVPLPNSGWTFQTTYSDIDNNAPQFVYAILGQATARSAQPCAASSVSQVTVVPPDPGIPGEAAPKLLNVVGVWDNPNGSGTNYYSGGSFDPATGVVTLGTSLAAASTVYVTYHCTPIVWAPDGSGTGRIALSKLDPGDIDFRDGAIFTTSAPVYFDGPATGNIAKDPPRLNYYSFAASDGFTRAKYAPNDARPSPGAYGVEMDMLVTGDQQTYRMTFNGFPLSSRPDPVSPVLLGPLAASAADGDLALVNTIVTLTPEGGMPQVLPQGDFASRMEYELDYALGTVRLGAAPEPGAPADLLQASYWFARALPMVQYNNPPVLTSGRLAPEVGSQFTTYTYTVTYTDTDGLNGTAPSYVRVVIDGTTYSMSRVSSGVPIYRNGVEYRYQTKLAPNTSHRYYFEASDGYGYAIFHAPSIPVSQISFDAAAGTTLVSATGQSWKASEHKNGTVAWVTGKRAGKYDTILDNAASTLTVGGLLNADPAAQPVAGDQFKVTKSESSLTAFTAPGAIDGPFINDAPYLTDGVVVAVGAIKRGDPVTYTVSYHDSDNDAPADGYPIAWVGGTNWEFNGGVTSRLYGEVTLITDDSQAWTPSQFKDQPLTWITGKRVGITDTILDNTSNMLIMSGRLDSSITTRPEVSDRFSILQATGTASAMDYRAAAFVDDTKAFAPDALAGERIQMVTGSGLGAVFDVAANTAEMLAISGRQLPTSSADPAVAATGVASGDSYSVHDFLVGAITLNANDGGLVSMKFNNSPGWVTDQFAGLVIQMMSGTAVWKKYTILNNTADTLYFSQQASVFVNDGVATGDLVRIAGLKMDKQSPGENDYTVAPGVYYTVTIPGLGLGDHTVKWMASNSPLVRGVRTTFQGRYPAGASVPGPLVTGDIPPGNTAPQLRNAVASPAIGLTTSNYRFSVDYRDADGDPPGPHDGVVGFLQLVVDAEINGQIVRRTYRSSVDPVSGGAWPVNIYRTIDSTVFSGFLLDASVAQLPPGTHRFHFEASDGWSVVRYPSNAADDPMVVVNSRPTLTIPAAGGVSPGEGNTGTTFRFRVIYADGDNQAPASISLVLAKGGVPQAPLILSQEVPSDGNYLDGAVYYVDTTLPAGTYTYYFSASDGVELYPVVTQSQPGPIVRGENNAPVLLEAAVTPAVSPFAGNEFNYTVRYRDQDNDPPNHVSLTVYAADQTTVLDTLAMEKADPDDTAYSSAEGVLYEYPGYHFGQSGTFFYQFSASDGVDATGDVEIMTGPFVNTPPALGEPEVDKMSGPSDELFTFGVTYTDADGVAPSADGYVRLVLTTGSTVTKVDMVRQAEDGWAGGVRYLTQIQLAPGTHSFYFEASDGLDPAASTETVSGLTVIATPGLRNPTVTPTTGKSTDTYSYTVTLANPSGSGPDEILVFIDGTGDDSAHLMTKVNPSDMNFAEGVRYIYTTQLAPSASIPGGKHTWFVRATVGGQTIYPPGQSPSTPSIGPLVNSAPALTEASVNPTFGRPSDTQFTFVVTYTDADKVAPGAGGYVRVVVSGVAYPMTAQASPDWKKPVVYTLATPLPGGQHSFYFEASDGIETTRLPAGSGQFDGPRVSARPLLTDGAVTPDTGTTATQFTYTVKYSDPEGDAPAVDGVQVLIDGQPHVMTRAAGVPNYVTGVTYTYTTTLGAGSHNFMFQATDGTDLITSPLQSGKPTVDAVGLTVNASPNPAALGSQITVSGEVLPKRAATLNVVLDRPAGANVNRTVTTDASGAYSFTFVTDEVGTWDVRVADPGTSASASISPKLTVNKATLRVQGGVVDMISSPVYSVTGDPSAVFGSAAALGLNIVKWVPAAGVYSYYGAALDFPVLGATSGFWIKPAATTTLELTGALHDQTQPIAARVSAGWNQIGSGFVTPVNWADVRVKYGTQDPVSLSEAQSRGWIRDYAWGYDPMARRYFLVRGSGGEASTLDPFRGYWVRSFVDCDLLIQPPAK